MKSIPEGLSNNFDILFIGRKSKINRSHKINLQKIEITFSIFSFLFNIFKTFKHEKTNYLLISINPYTFFAYILLFIFRKKIFVYLRSNGYEEYKAIFGFIGPFIYHAMYILVTFKSKVIVCQNKLTKKKERDLVFPSELDENWFKNITKPMINKPKLLYVGRMKIEKGIFSLSKIFDEIFDDIELSVTGNINDIKTNNKKINFLGYGYDSTKLINIYDNHNILILPSFTEAHPKVIDESLARQRPVIIFEEISHVVQDRSGVFISQRNSKSLSKIIKFIIANYSSIQASMLKNKLPTKRNFISQMTSILNSN